MLSIHRIFFVFLALDPLKATAFFRPFAICEPTTICSTSRISAEQIGSRSFSITRTPVSLSIDDAGPWPEAGLYTVVLTVVDQQGRESTANCRVRVTACEAEAALSCPIMPFLPAKNVAGDSTVSIKRSSRLCTLTLVTSDGEALKPLARSYGLHDWEAYGGLFGRAPSSCSDDSCTFDLPALAAGETYKLTTFSHRPNEREQIARFLEQSTFGPTLDEIGNFSTPEEWIQKQLDLPVTSHRQFYRERATHNYEFSAGIGRASVPCEQGARWRKYAFSRKDQHRGMHIRVDDASGKWTLSIHNNIRLFVEEGGVVGYFNGGFNATYPVGWTWFCRSVLPFIGGEVVLWHPQHGCPMNMYFDGVEGNPTIKYPDGRLPSNGFFLNLESGLAPARIQDDGGNIQEMTVESGLTDPQCASLQTITNDHMTIGIRNGEYWLHSPTFMIRDNTVDSPLSDGGGELQQITKNYHKNRRIWCSNAPRTFLNEHGCKLSYEPDACTSKELPNIVIPLESQSFRKIFQVTGEGSGGTRYVYAISNLRQSSRLETAPCTPNARSRWVPDECNRGREVHEDTNAAFASLFRLSTDENPFVVDIYFPATSLACDPTDVNKFDFQVQVSDGRCFRNVHPDTLQVYDFTVWTTQHPGNTRDFNPIRDLAVDADSYELQFPASHDMDRWASNKGRFSSLGRLGDSVNYRDLPNSLLRDDVALAFGGFDEITESGAVLVCGSPNEVANKPGEFGMVGYSGFDIYTRHYRATSVEDFLAQRTTVWAEIALNGEDQLRQRMAWALSQILVVSPFAISVKEQTELFMVYYDIFVRHGLGNYRDVLKEVSFSPMMAEMLSYLDSKSTAFVWATQKRKEAADENYAREVMQLFSVGLDKLNSDGSMKLEDGAPSRTYSNIQITEYARVWTGFMLQSGRGNIEDATDPPSTTNQVDPMRINIDWRDPFPKLGLDEKYLGDGWPLCSDLPRQHFLKRGAKFRQVGSIASSQLQSSSVVQPSDSTSRFALQPSSALYRKLCNAEQEGFACRFQSVVILDEPLPCFGAECQINALRTFEVEPGVFYEYIRPSCVHHAFPTDGKMIKTISNGRDFICADPGIDLAGATCCDMGDDGSEGSMRNETFFGERLPMEMAASRCSGMGKSLCDFPTISDCGEGSECDPNLHYWTNQGCQVQVKIDIDGRVGLVHDMDDNRVSWNQIGQFVQERTVSFYHAVWSGPIDSFLSNFESRCVELGCEIVEFDGLCLCDVIVENEAVFEAGAMPTKEQILNELHVGAVPSEQEGYVVTPGVKLHLTTGSFDENTIFEVVDNYGVTRWRKNLRSTVKIGESGLSFRNPTQFIALSDPEVRDALYETDAALDSYFYHPNTAPFLAVRLAQRFGFSNPSPRYVQAIGEAFRSGTYESNGFSFGSGTYGDLAAAVAAILLDREARTPDLDADPVHGAVLEPFIKVIRLMRSLNYQPSENKPMLQIGKDLLLFIGQEAHKLPNVFSFFKPAYQPAGVVERAGLVSPESQVLNAVRSKNLVNAMLSFLKYGVKSCYEGFGTNWQFCNIGNTPGAQGYTAYSAPALPTAVGVVDELAMLLTSGRLSSANRLMIENAYRYTLLNGKIPKEAIINVQQLLAMTPEFHTNTVVQNELGWRPVPSDPPPSERPYKAVIYVFLDGGYDSYGMLVPHTCSATNSRGQTPRDQYNEARGVLAFLDGEERSVVINATSSNQVCEEFALFDELKLLKELYDDGDLTFFANVGQIDRNGLTKHNYRQKSVSRIFDHLSMQNAARAVDPFERAPGSGVLGRAADVLHEKGYQVGSVAIDDLNHVLQNEAAKDTPPQVVVGRTGAKPFTPRPGNEIYFPLKEYALRLNGKAQTQSNAFSEVWASQLSEGIHQGTKISDYLSTTLSGEWDRATYNGKGLRQELFQKFNTIAKMIKSRERRGADRDFYYTVFGGWDHHRDTRTHIRPRFEALNYGLTLLVNELKAQGVWENVTIAVTSEFARTITVNSGDGCDHGWGGNYFFMGGDLKGGKIMGEFPQDITQQGPLNIGYGRIIPTTSWDAIWNGVGEWLDVDSEKLDQILPNRLNSVEPGFKLFSGSELYESMDEGRRSNLRRAD